jgi:plastocyanin
MTVLRTLAAFALLSLPVFAEGTISGKVDATPAKYLEETVVYLKEVPGTYPARSLAMDQKGMKFIPHMLTATVGDTVKFLNNDGVDHNVYTPDGETYNLGLFPKGKSADYKFTKPGAYSQLCSVHPEMLAYIFVSQNPYAAIVGKDGKFKLEKVPAGNWKIAVWNPQLKAPEQAVTVADGKNAEVGFAIKR